MTCSVQSGETSAGAQPLADSHGAAQGDKASGVTPSLLAAALSGLLCLSGCGSDEPSVNGPVQDASAADSGQDASTGRDAAAGEPTQDAATELTPDAASEDAATVDAAIEPPVKDEKPRITLSRVDETMTEASFREQCEKLHGALELHPGCGGANSCRGMSYDIDTHVYTEHTCKGLNTCSGFSCVLPESA